MTFSDTYIFSVHIQDYLPQSQSSSPGSDGSGANSSSPDGSGSGSKTGTSPGSGHGFEQLLAAVPVLQLRLGGRQLLLERFRQRLGGWHILE